MATAVRASPVATRSEVIAVLRDHADAIRKLGATGLYLFGSAARDELRPDSDVDLFIDYDVDKVPSLFDLASLEITLSDGIGRTVEVALADLCIRASRPRSRPKASRYFNMPRTILAGLDDILEAIEGVESVVAQHDAESFCASFVATKAVERCLEIISEGSRHVPDHFKSEFPDVPWREIKAIGNRLRHEYDRVDQLVVWRTATESLPQLRPVIVGMIQRAEREKS